MRYLNSPGNCLDVRKFRSFYVHVYFFVLFCFVFVGFFVYLLFFFHTFLSNTNYLNRYIWLRAGIQKITTTPSPARSRDELIRDVLLWTPTHGRAKAGRPARTYIQQLCEDTGCCPEDLPRAMNDREEWRERVKDIRATSAIWWWWWWWQPLLIKVDQRVMATKKYFTLPNIPEMKYQYQSSLMSYTGHPILGGASYPFAGYRQHILNPTNRTGHELSSYLYFLLHIFSRLFWPFRIIRPSLWTWGFIQLRVTDAQCLLNF